MKIRINPVVLVCGLTVATTCVAGEFVPGHVYIAVEELEACDFGGQEWIIEIDPDTGESTIFADSSDDLCVVSGLRFTPDGMNLRALNAGHLNPFDLGWVLEFDGQGAGNRILDGDDGLSRPVGFNGLAFDTAENFYIVNPGHSEILRFPADGAEATVFADFDDGIVGRGALDFAPNGDLFYAGEFIEGVLRITPEGEGILFDTLIGGDEGFPQNVTFDSDGNLFVGTFSHAPTNEAHHLRYAIYRYDSTGPRSPPDPDSRRLLVAGFADNAASLPAALTYSPERGALYFAVQDSSFPDDGVLYAIDPVTGDYDVVADFSALADLAYFVFPTGIAVYPEPLPELCEGDANLDGTVDPLDSGFVLARFGCAVGVGDDDCDAADQNGDGAVDPLDVGFVLARFGDCL